MSQDPKPPSIFDDPTVQAGLSDLDRGLDRTGVPGGDDLEQPAPPTSGPLPAVGVQPSAAGSLPSSAGSPQPAPSEVFPESSFQPPLSRFARAVAEAGIPAEPAGSVAPASDGPRPLLDLFPPAPARERASPLVVSRSSPVGVRGPVTTGAPPPRIVRSRFATKPEPVSGRAAAPLKHEQFYGLSERPFSLSTDPKFIYHSSSHDRVVQDLIDALGRGDGVMVLTGEMGIGKTTLCRSLVEQLGRRTVTAFITDPVVSFDDLLKKVLVDFGVVSAEDGVSGRLAHAGRPERIAAIGDFAASLAPLQASAAIVIDEAQDVPPDILEPLAALTDRTAVDRRVQLVLVGQPALTSVLHSAGLRSLDRTVAVRCRLEALQAEETIGYVVHRLAIAGASARVEFEDRALAALHAATGGVPGLVNLVCDRALTRGYEASASVIDEGLIQDAAADLELAPPRAATRWMARVAVNVLVFVALMLAGAAAAAWLFRDDVARLINSL